MNDLTKTITYYYIQGNSIFETIKERDNFIRYSEYMMFSNFDEPHPIPDEDYKEYFRDLYKAVEMMYEEDIMEYENEIKCNFDDYYDTEKYCEYCNEEDLYLIYYEIYK